MSQDVKSVSLESQIPSIRRSQSQRKSSQSRRQSDVKTASVQSTRSVEAPLDKGPLEVVKSVESKESATEKTWEGEEVSEEVVAEVSVEVVAEVSGEVGGEVVAEVSQASRHRSHMSDEEVGLAQGFFCSFLMKLDVDYYKTALCGAKPHPPSVVSAFLETGPPICHMEQGWRGGVRPYQLEEDWEYLDELQDEEKLVLVASWRLLRRRLVSLGKTLLLKFFKTNPELRELFSELRSLKQDELASSRQLTVQGQAVMKALDRIVSNVKKPAACMRIIHEMGVNHKKHLLDVDHFNRFKETFIEVAKTELKEQFSLRVEKVWTKFLTIILGIMEDTVKMDAYGRTRKIDKIT